MIAADGTLGGYGGYGGDGGDGDTDRDAALRRKQALLLREGVTVGGRAD